MTSYTLAVLRRHFFASYVQSGFPARPAVRAINCGPYFKYSGALARGLARFDRFRVAQRDGPLPVASLVSDDRILDASVFHYRPIVLNAARALIADPRKVSNEFRAIQM